MISLTSVTPTVTTVMCTALKSIPYGPWTCSECLGDSGRVLVGTEGRCFGSTARPELATPLKEEEQGAASRWVPEMTEDPKVRFWRAERQNVRIAQNLSTTHLLHVCLHPAGLGKHFLDVLGNAVTHFAAAATVGGAEAGRRCAHGRWVQTTRMSARKDKVRFLSASSWQLTPILAYPPSIPSQAVAAARQSETRH